MTDAGDERDWTRSPVRVMAGAVVLGFASVALAMGWWQGRSPLDTGAHTTLPAAASRLIDVNTATAPELDLLPRIGPKRAAAIIENRERNGAFRSLDDLQRVHGIGPRTVESLRQFARVGPAE